MISLAILVVLILILILLISVRNKAGTFWKIIILITCCVIGAYILINIAWLLYFFFLEISRKKNYGEHH